MQELSKQNDLRPILDEIETRLKQMKFSVKRIRGMDAFKQITSKEYFQTPKTRIIGEQQLTETELFPRKQFKVDGKLCFVLMPFDKKYDSVYNNIKYATDEMGLKAKRA